ncbi:MAG: flippase-like domain-containing protein [Cyclobacteriaceae bacterium]|nr:flippase-like domain-containing protein [Cyclobacteriaceae bacterium]
MSDKFKNILKFFLLFGVAVALLWLSLGSLKVGDGESRFGFIFKVWKTANKPFLVLSAITTILSHIFRSERWKILMTPLGFPLKSTHGFFSVMIGYFVNLAIPRGGEISRCYNLYKLNDTPIDQSFGTVVAERVIDLFFLLFFISLAFVIELDNLLFFFKQLNYNGNSSGKWITYLIVFLGGISVIVLLLLLFRKIYHWKYLRWLVKFKKTLIGLKKGLFVIFNMKQKGLFIVYSLGIWVMYILMSYTIILAFPETGHLGLLESLTIFAIGGIAMAIPLPGGTGSYHVLVPLGLVLLYNIKQEEAIAFSFIFHGWQTLMIIILGLLSLFGSQWYIRKRRYAVTK